MSAGATVAKDIMVVPCPHGALMVDIDLDYVDLSSVWSKVKLAGNETAVVTKV